MTPVISLIIGVAELVTKTTLKVGGKGVIWGTKKLAMKSAPNALKIAAQNKAHAKALTAAKYKASLLMSHGIPAKHVIVKTAAGKSVYVVTASKPVIIANGAGKVMLTLETTAKGFMVKATPIAAGVVKAGLAKGVLVGVGKAVAIGGAVLVGLVGGGSL